MVRGQPPVERIVRPFQDFAHKQSSGGIVLIAAAVIALVWANSPWGESYSTLWHTKLTIGVGDFSISKDLTHWINDGLMAIFFLVVGLRSEEHTSELQSRQYLVCRLLLEKKNYLIHRYRVSLFTAPAYSSSSNMLN